MKAILAAIIALTLGTALIGCASDPVPDDHFYRFGQIPANEKTFEQHAIPAKLYVEMPLAAGIRRERAILYSEDPGHVELRRYHYHLWEDQPPRMIQRRLVDRMIRSGAAPAVTDQLTSDTIYRMRVRVERFERELSSDGATVALALRFQVVQGHRQGTPIFDASYSERIPAQGEDMVASVRAFTEGIDRVIDRLFADLAAALTI